MSDPARDLTGSARFTSPGAVSRQNQWETVAVFTDCPSCERQFRVRAEHLSSAGGRVRCGYCGALFNALERLRDAPLARTSPEPPHTATVHSDLPEPEFQIPPRPAPVPPRRPSPAGQAAPELPPELVSEPAPPGARASRLLWRAFALLLMLGAAAQAAWFNRDHLLERFPQFLPAARELCARWNCELIRYRDLGSISLLNRDVRLHPVIEGALLVNVTMVNRAGHTQPFPRVQLVLFDTGGRPVAQRVFAPREYLDASMELDQGMDPGLPVHFVLEVAGANENAAGFEFGFKRNDVGANQQRR